MKSFLKFLAITFGILLLSSILAPILVDFLPFKFEKIFNRLIMIFTLAAVAIFVRLDLKKVRDYGLRWGNESLQQLWLGFGGGILLLVLVTLAKMSAKMAYWDVSDFSIGVWIYKYAIILLTAFFIGALEEFFFRGMVYKSLTENAKWRMFWAVFLTSLFYSLLHFVNVQKPYIGENPQFFDSLRLIAAPFRSFLNWQEYWRAAIGLFIFGIVLNLAAIQTRALWMSIGLHAGCVFFIKIDGSYVEILNDSPLIWGSGKMYDGLVGWIGLGLLGIFLSLLNRKFKTNSI